MASYLARPLRTLIASPMILRHSSKFTKTIKDGTKGKNLFASPETADFYNPNHPPYETDVVIIGGGVMGSSIAYHLKRDAEAGLNVVVVERDSTVVKHFETKHRTGKLIKCQSESSLILKFVPFPILQKNISIRTIKVAGMAIEEPTKSLWLFTAAVIDISLM